MADLLLSLGEWSGYVSPLDIISSICLLDNDIFLGCRSGLIHVLHRSSLVGRMLLQPSIPSEIVGLTIGRYTIDQPHSVVPTLISIDSCGNLSAWAIQDGRCLMYNSTGINASGLISSSDHAIVWSNSMATIWIFRTKTLELVQTVEISRPVRSICLDSSRLICLLIEGKVVELVFDQALGRIGSQENFAFENSCFRAIDCVSGSLLTISKDEVTAGNRKIKFSDVIAGLLIESYAAVFWSNKGSVYMVTDDMIELSSNSFISASTKDYGVVYLVTFDMFIIEATIIDSRPTISKRQIPMIPHHHTASLVKCDEVYLSNSDGEVYLNSLEGYCLNIGSDLRLLKSKYEISAILPLEPDFLIVGTRTGRIQVWDKSKQICAFESRNHTSSIKDIFLINRQKIEFVCAAEDGGISIYQTDPDHSLKAVISARLGIPLQSIRWAFDHDDFIWLEYLNGSNYMWNLKSRARDTIFSNKDQERNDFLNLFKNIRVIDEKQSLRPSISLNIREILSSENLKLLALLPKIISFESNRLKTLAIGIHGAGSNVSFFHPETNIWNQSPVLSATISLILITVLHFPSSLKDSKRLDHQMDHIWHSQLMMPSLSSLSKFWIDPSPCIQSASRLLLNYVSSKVSESYLIGFLEYWANCLPNFNVSNAKSMNRSAIILGILALSQRPELFNETILKSITESLVSQIYADRPTLFRTAAIEIMGSGFRIWKPYVQPLILFRKLFSWLVSVAPTDESERVLEPSLMTAIAATEQTLLQILSMEKYAILPYWIGEISSSKLASERSCGLALLNETLRVSPETLEEYLILVLDHVTRLLDPTFPLMRTAMVPLVTPLIVEFTRAFSTVRLHKESQRLLVGGPRDGTVIVYELRTATRSHAFEGLTRGATAVAFSPSAKYICAYSFDEATIRTWAVPSGILSILGNVYKPVKTLVVKPEISEAFIEAKNQEANSHNVVDIEWTSEKSVVITVKYASPINMNLL